MLVGSHDVAHQCEMRSDISMHLGCPSHPWSLLHWLGKSPAASRWKARAAQLSLRRLLHRDVPPPGGCVSAHEPHRGLSDILTVASVSRSCSRLSVAYQNSHRQGKHRERLRVNQLASVFFALPPSRRNPANSKTRIEEIFSWWISARRLVSLKVSDNATNAAFATPSFRKLPRN